MRFLPDSPPGDRRPREVKPPQAAERFIAAHLGSGPRTDFILGDLREDFEERRARWPGWLARLWFWAMVLGLWIRLPRRGRRRPGARQMESFVQDVRFGIRSLRKSPAFTATAVSTLAVGIGATIAIFTVANGILFRSLPYPDSDRLAVIRTNTGGPGWYGSSQPEFMDFQDELESFESLGIVNSAEVTLADSAAPRRVRIGIVTSEVLPLVGVAPRLGRFPTVEEDRPDGPRVAVISHGLWQQEFGGADDVLGEDVALGSQRWTVVGVMPPGFDFPDADLVAWLPYRLDPANPITRANHNFPVVGRLAPGVSLDAARAEVEVHTARIRERYPENYAVRGYRTRVESLHERVVGESRTGVLLLLGAAILVLVVACVNVSNLSLARGDPRRVEFAVRGALGAGRGRVARLLLIESALLALIGGLAGLALGTLGLQALLALAGDSLPRTEGLGIDGTALLASGALVAISLVLFGLGPALTGVKDELRSALASSRGGSARRKRTVRRALVVSQLSLAGLLAIGAGTMIRTLSNLNAVDLGFRTENALTLAVNPSGASYSTPEEAVALYERLVPRLGAIPGVESAAAHAAMPLGGQSGNLSVLTEDAPDLEISAAPDGWRQVSTPDYFATMGIALRAGRLFDAGDRGDAAPVAVVNETLARTLWPGEEAVGRRFRMFAEGWPWMEVVGVVADVRHRQPDEPADPRFYVPHAQAYATAYASPLNMYVTLRTRGEPLDLVPAVRAAMAEVDPGVPVSDIRTLEARVAGAVSDRRFVTRLLQAFGLIALLLAAVGVYGVMSLAVNERAGELGLRKALGAPGSRLVRMVLRETLVLAAVGAGLALLGGLAFGRLIRGLLYGVSPADPLTLVMVGLALALTATLAALVPARRASRVDPMDVLRVEG